MINIVEPDGAVQKGECQVGEELPTLQEIVSGTWKKEEDLKQLKSEAAVLERKIQLELTPSEKQAQTLDGKNKFQENILTSRPGFHLKDENKPKGFKI